MASTDIDILLDKIKHAVYGEDMREAIHDAIKECYNKLTQIEAELNELKK